MKKIGKWLGLGFAALLLLGFLFLMLLPTYFSTNSGKNWLLGQVSEKDYTITASAISLNWLSSQEIDGIHVINENKEEVFSCPKISISSSLWKILFFGNDAGEVRVFSPKTTIYPPKVSKGVVSHKSKKRFVLPVTGHLILENGSLQVDSHGISFDSVNISLNFPRHYTPLTLTIKGETHQQNQIGTIDIDANFENILSSEPSGNVKINCDHIPIAGIDAIINTFSPKWGTMLPDLIGKEFDLDVTSTLSPTHVEIDMSLQSTLAQAKIVAHTEGDAIVLNSPGSIHLQVTQQLLDLFSSGSDYELQKNTDLTLTITKLSIPTLNKIDFGKLQATANVILSPADLYDTDAKRAYSIGKTTLSFHTLSLEDSLEVVVDSQITSDKEPGSFHFSAQAEKIFTNEKEIKIDLQANNFPLLLASPEIKSLIGNKIDFSVSGSVAKQSSLTVSGKTDYLSIQPMQIHFVDQKIELTNPAKMEYTFHFPELFKDTPHAQVDISSLEIPIQDISKSEIHLQISGPDFEFAFPLLEKSPFLANIQINSLDQIAIRAKTDSLNISLDAAYDSQSKVAILKKPMQVQWTVSPQVWAAALPKIPIKESFQLRGSVEPVSFFIEKAELPPLSISASATPIYLSSSTLEGLSFSTDLQTRKNSLSFSVDSNISSGQNKGAFSASGLIQDGIKNHSLALDAATLQMKVTFKNLPTKIIEDLIENNILAQAIGPSIQGQMALTSTPIVQNISLNITSEYLNVDGALKIENGEIVLQNSKTPICFDLLLTKEGYQFLTSMWMKDLASKFQLTDNSHVNFCLSDLDYRYTPLNSSSSFENRFPTKNFNWDLLNYKMLMKIDNLSLSKSSNEKIVLKNFQMNALKSVSQNQISFDLNGVTAVISKMGSQEGNLTLKGSILNEKNMSWDPSNLSITVDGVAKQLPSPFLDLIYGKGDYFFSSLFGDVSNITLKTSLKGMSGPIDCNLFSPNFRIGLKGVLKEGMLYLNDALYAQMELNKDFTQRFLQGTPIAKVYSKDPVSINVSPQSFSFPVYPYDPSKINISSARIELGQIFCENTKNSGALLKILKSSTVDKTIKLWFAPMDLQIKNGDVNIERTEILVNDTFDVAIWKEVNLVTEEVDMVLGLTAQALKQAFGISKLPEDYVLQIPIHGPFGNVEIDTSSATAKVGALLAWQHQETLGSLGGKAGSLFGEFLGSIATLPDRNSPAPPAKHPFPWEEQAPTPKSKPSKKKSKAIHKEDSALKQLWDIMR